MYLPLTEGGEDALFDDFPDFGFMGGMPLGGDAAAAQPFIQLFRKLGYLKLDDVFDISALLGRNVMQGLALVQGLN